MGHFVYAVHGACGIAGECLFVNNTHAHESFPDSAAHVSTIEFTPPRVHNDRICSPAFAKKNITALLPVCPGRRAYELPSCRERITDGAGLPMRSFIVKRAEEESGVSEVGIETEGGV